MKISFIGAGSIGFTQTLVRDLLKVPEFQDITFSFHDISEKNLDLVSRLIQKDIEQNKLPAKIEQSTDRKKSLDGAKYIINCTRIGGLEAFEYDINIPLQYGVDQCVGDTICAGGILYGQRNIPQTLNFCEDIKSYSHTDALFLNYSKLFINVGSIFHYSVLSCKALTIPESLFPPDCNEAMTFLAGDCNKVIISPINSFLDLRSASADKFSSPTYRDSSR